MSLVLFSRVTQVGSFSRSVAPRPAERVAAHPPKFRGRPAPVMMYAGPRPSQPGGPAPKSKGRFFESVARRLMDIAKREGPESASGQWAGRFAAALNQYIAAEVAFAAMPKPLAGDADAASVHKATQHRVAERLDVVLRMRERAPADLIAKLGDLPRGDQDVIDTIPPIGAWASLSRALTLSRMLLVSPTPAPVLLPAPAADPVGSLDYLRKLIEVISEARIDLPDVTRWSIDIKEALAGFDDAEEKLKTQGPGMGGVRVYNALQCCEALLDLVGDQAERALPFSPGTFTHPKANFNASQRWLDEAGDYMRGGKLGVSKSDRVCDYLCVRHRDLKAMSLPYEATFT